VFRIALGFVCGICEAAFDSEDALLGHLDSPEHVESMSTSLQRESVPMASCLSAFSSGFSLNEDSEGPCI